MPTRKQLENAKRLLREHDWSKVDALSDDTIIAAAKADPDTALPTDADLAEFNLVLPAKSRNKPREAAE